MKSSTIRSLVAIVSILLALGACRGKENAAADDGTATIAPAQPQPQPTGTDAMTQTVEVGDGRSVNEGGALAEGSTTDTGTTDTGTTDTAATAPPPPPTTTR